MRAIFAAGLVLLLAAGASAQLLVNNQDVQALAKDTFAKQELIIFGDSHSDTGNHYRSPNVPAASKCPNNQFWWNGRFTNWAGNWVDYIQKYTALGFDVKNYAWFGAHCQERNDKPFGIQDFGHQISAFTDIRKLEDKFRNDQNNDHKEEDRVAVIWIGHEDVIAGKKTPEAIWARMKSQIDALLGQGMRRPRAIIVASLAPLHLAPGNKAGKNFITASHIDEINKAIRQGCAGYKAPKGITTRVLFWDAHNVLKNVHTNFRLFLFTNNDKACVTGHDASYTKAGARCPLPNQSVWYDDWHFSTKVHDELAKDLSMFMTRNNCVRLGPNLDNKN